MKYIKHLLIITIFATGTVMAATWSGTSAIRDGQVISAQTMKDNLDFLYERRWNLINNNLTTTKKVGIGDTTPDSDLRLDVGGKVGANQYCDQNGNNCFTANDVDNFDSRVTVIENGSGSTNVYACPVDFSSNPCGNGPQTCVGQIQTGSTCNRAHYTGHNGQCNVSQIPCTLVGTI